MWRKLGDVGRCFTVRSENDGVANTGNERFEVLVGRGMKNLPAV